MQLKKKNRKILGGVHFVFTQHAIKHLTKKYCKNTSELFKYVVTVARVIFAAKQKAMKCRNGGIN